MSHIAVERNRRRQMNDHLKVLRSLTPCFYIKKSYHSMSMHYAARAQEELSGDQASIIGGAIEFIKELHQILQSLESQKRRKSLSPSPTPSPRPRPQLSPNQLNHEPLLFDHGTNELVACCNSAVADVEAKISGSNVILRTVSRRIPGHLLKIICLLEKLSFEILHLNVSSIDNTVLYSFVVKIGLECKLSVEELALEVQHSFNHEQSKSITDNKQSNVFQGS